MPNEYTPEQARSGVKAELPEIETFTNQWPDQNYLITHEAPEYTSICPKTGLPDFGTIKLEYIPADKCVELKSYKYYILAYRNLGIFYENLSNRILQDVVAACQPKWARVTATMGARGGISSVLVAQYPSPDYDDANEVAAELSLGE